MKNCPFCAEEIQDAAIVCKHCQRDLVAAPTKAVAVTTTGTVKVRQADWISTMAKWGVGLLVLFVIIAIAGSVSQQNPSKPMKTMDVKVSANAVTLVVSNDDDAAAAGKEADIYINGTPPFTYRSHTTVPSVGSQTTVALSDFVKKNGERFSPTATAVTEVWIGGNGYDFQKFTFRR